MRYALTLLAVAWPMLIARIGLAEDVRTDVNIVTGLDVSGSIEAVETQIQIDGMVMAIRSPEVVNAIRGGRYGRIGFTVFVWANGNFPVFAEWRLIGSAQEAQAVSEDLAQRLRDIMNSGIGLRLGELTDLSGALSFGGAMLQSAPYVADRSILNIMGNGLDNVGEGPALARQWVLAQGGTINGVVIGHDRGVTSYFRREVIGGPAAFLLTAQHPETLVDVLKRKFATEIALNAEAIGAGDQAPR